MKQIEKDEILKQVGSVLQFCHGIVSRLSRLECSSSSPSPPIQSSTIANYELNNNYENVSWNTIVYLLSKLPSE